MDRSSPASPSTPPQTAPPPLRAAAVGLAVDLLAAVDAAEGVLALGRRARPGSPLASIGTIRGAGALLDVGARRAVTCRSVTGPVALAGLAAPQFVLELLVAIL